MKKKVSFEEALKNFEEIVASLENGQLPLDEAYSKFEEGVKLGKYCEDILSNTEKKVEILLSKSEDNPTANTEK